MLRRVAGWRCLILVASGVATIGAGVPAEAGEDPRTITQFLNELKAHGLYDQASYFIGQLRQDSTLPSDQKAILDYEEGRILIDEASRSDLVRRDELLREAKEKLDGFVKTNPQAPEAREALVQIGKLLFERGYMAVLLGEEAQDKAKKESRLAEARSAYSEARGVYGKAVEALAPVLAKFPVSMPENDPRRPQRDAVEASYLNAMLQQGVCDHELAQTFPEDSAERTRLLDGALKQFDSMNKEHRTQWAGLAARMWQAKCYEEKGELGPAIGLYKELLEHSDPHLRDLQRFVGYFYVVALYKRKEYPLAADQAVAWLNTFNRKSERLTREGLGIQFELARAIDAQMPNISQNDRPAAVRKIVEALGQVVRFPSPFKKEALTLLRKYKPSAAIKAEEIAKLNYQDAMEHADEAMGEHDWARAIALLKHAVRKIDGVREPDKMNAARYNLAFCYYMDKRYYEAYVIADHLAHRYPQGGLAPKSTLIGMQALVDAYNTFTEVDRISDIDRVIEMAKYTAETWPDREEGDDARLDLGQIYLGRGQYDQSIAALAAIPRKSTRWLEGQTRLGGAHWARSRVLERRGDTKTATAEAQKARQVLEAALKARRDANTAPTDPGLVGNVGDLAIVLTESGNSADALKLVDPVIKAQTTRSGPGFSRLMEAQLMAFIGTNQVNQAIATMKALEQAGGGAGLTQLYLKLGRLLRHELDALEQKGNTAAFTQMHQSYRTFLTTLADAKSGQTYESLQWAGESLLDLGAYADAEKVLSRVLKDFAQNPEFLQQPGGPMNLLRTRLKLAAALRGRSEFDAANSLVEEILSQYPKYLEPQLEKGMLLEAEADANHGDWSASLAYWKQLARKLQGARPTRLEYYDAWYHISYAYMQMKQPLNSKRALQGIMRLSPSVGSPEMKAKYQALLNRLSKS